jgi:hypothetical protein
MTCLLAGTVTVVGGMLVAALVAPVEAVAVPSVVVPAEFGIPAWSPMRAPARVNCVRTNCPGPYHGDWAIDFIDTNSSTFEPLFAAAPGIAHIGALVGADTCAPEGTAHYGNWVWIDHGAGRTTRYTHLDAVLVTEGQHVTPRTKIGTMGHSGQGAPCRTNYLHMEFRVNNVKVKPPSMSACVGASRDSLPASLGYAEWNLVPTNQNPVTGLKPNVYTPAGTSTCMP